MKQCNPMTRDFSLSTYLPLQAVKDLCTQNWISHYAYITHDSDTNEDGTPKQVHTHILLRTVERLSFNAIQRRINRFAYDYYYGSGETVQNTFIEFTQDVDDAFRYLTHSTEQARLDGKFQYDSLDIVSDNIGYWRGEYSSTANKNNNALDIITDMENGLTERQLLVRYGREYLINRSKYKEFLFAMVEQECPRCVLDENGELLPTKTALNAIDRQMADLEQKLKFLKTIKEGYNNGN